MGEEMRREEATRSNAQMERRWNELTSSSRWNDAGLLGRLRFDLTCSSGTQRNQRQVAMRPTLDGGHRKSFPPSYRLKLLPKWNPSVNIFDYQTTTITTHQLIRRCTLLIVNISQQSIK